MLASEALALVRENARREGKPKFGLFLAVGFTANQVATFVTAAAARRRPDRHVVCSIGQYGDVIGALNAAEAREAHAALVALEWADLDPRLGLRRFRIVTGDVAADILETASARLDMLACAVERQADATPVVIALPTLPMGPVFPVPGRQVGLHEISLRRLAFNFAERCLGVNGVSVVAADRLDRASPLAERHAPASELGADMPYGPTHLSALAEALIDVALPPGPLKGLITDLDDTLWRGLVGEVGADGVSWSLDAQSHIHAVYQGLLAGLAGQGMLVAVASKNDPAVAAKALARPDLRLDLETFYPVEVGWGAKSLAVERILARWNIGADAVAFVDDSPIEVAEVQARFPEMTGVVFPTLDDPGALATIERIRDLFGRSKVTEVDKIRAASIVRSAQFLGEAAAEGQAPEAFLETLKGRLTFNFCISPDNDRPLELINKTNQFNLNGRRIDVADWKRHLQTPHHFTLAIDYADKFGPLGTISVAAGYVDGTVAVLTSWVLSCRAFARRIEHATLAVLAERLGVSRFSLEFAATEKNGPMRAFLDGLGVSYDGEKVLLSNPIASLPPLYHEREIHEH